MFRRTPTQRCWMGFLQRQVFARFAAIASWVHSLLGVCPTYVGGHHYTLSTQNTQTIAYLAWKSRQVFDSNRSPPIFVGLHNLVDTTLPYSIADRIRKHERPTTLTHYVVRVKYLLQNTLIANYRHEWKPIRMWRNMFHKQNYNLFRTQHI